MIDLKALRENPEAFKNSQKVRGEDPAIVDQLLAADDARREAISEFESLRAEQNTLSKAVGAAKGDEKNSLLENAKQLATAVKSADAKRAEAEEAANKLALLIANLIDPAAPIGGEADFKVIEKVGTPRVKAGFIPMIPPVLVKPAAMEGTGFLGQAAENVYHLKEDELYLVGTSEVPLAAYHMDEILEQLPIRYAGYSPCFRREAGSYGKDTRGIIRVHQFEKVEMFTFCKPEDAQAEHEKLLKWEKDFFDSLEIPYQVIDVASGDLGASAVRKFDIEAWIPTQQAYREVTSTSNCTQFQARRLNIRYKDEKATKPVATLNGTLVAVPRTIVAILENYQQKDGSVKVPKALIPFIGMDTLVCA